MAFYDSIKLEKGMYGTSYKSFTENLESIDPSENYENTPLAGLDAYQRQLKRFDIKVSGSNSDVIDKFFKTSDSSVLFPEYITRAVRQGMEAADVLPSIVAAKTQIECMDYRSIVSNPTEDDKELKPVLEGTYLPQTTVTTQNNLVKLNKRGRMLVSSYEAIRFQHLDLFTVTLKQIGAYIVRSQLKDAIDVLLNGDGNNNAAVNSGAGSETTLSYSNLIGLWASLAPYELNTIIANTDTVQDILNLAEMKDATAGLNFQGTGKLVTPFGATLLHVPCVTEDTVIGIDKNCALEMVQAGDIITDYDKLIDRQLQRTSISVISGFAKIFAGATKKFAY